MRPPEAANPARVSGANGSPTTTCEKYDREASTNSWYLPRSTRMRVGEAQPWLPLAKTVAKRLPKLLRRYRRNLRQLLRSSLQPR